MEIKVGEYYRTKNGLIRQVKTINTPETRKAKKIGWTKNNVPLVNGRHTLDDISKHSPNIIDLIEEDDYVNGECVDKIKNGEEFYGEEYYKYIVTDYLHVIKNSDIESIVTHEQFSSLEYEI